jgi:oligopeptide/dipeptide ABC transporter ATP-binding protein
MCATKAAASPFGALMPSPRTLLNVRGLTTIYDTPRGRVRAVDDISFNIDRGSILGLVGESGCGKSVTARSVMRLVDLPGRIVEGSSVEFDGHELLALSEPEMRALRGRQISMIFQEPTSSLNPVFPVGDQVAESVRFHMRLSRRASLERALEMFTLVGIPSARARLDSYPYEMSGGMQQRVMIAMALACEPKLLIADEPTTALDVTIQAQILDLLLGLRERLGMAIILITHDLGVIAEMADEVAVMYAGRIVETGDADHIFQRARHPYTAALMRSIPRLGTNSSEPLRVIRGMIPNAFDWPRGCRFAPRCDFAFDRCTAEEPRLMPAGSQRAACWLNVAGRDPSGEEVPA